MRIDDFTKHYIIYLLTFTTVVTSIGIFILRKIESMHKDDSYYDEMRELDNAIDTLREILNDDCIPWSSEEAREYNISVLSWLEELRDRKREERRKLNALHKRKNKS